MMVSGVKIAAVSYLNTIPFIYGIEHSANFNADLQLLPPALCAEAYMEGRVDIALVPVAAIQQFKDYQIVTEYCIGASGSVRTVVMMSNEPLQSIERVWLDPHSMTSVQLAGWLAAHHWHITPKWLDISDYSQIHSPQSGDAFVLIGDKVFQHEGALTNTWDLSSEWLTATKLPFAFAVWIARKGTDLGIIEELQQALTFGIEHTWEAIVEYGYDDRPYAYEYLTQNIDFIFDNQKHKALSKFWDEGLKVNPRINPG